MPLIVTTFFKGTFGGYFNGSLNLPVSFADSQDFSGNGITLPVELDSPFISFDSNILNLPLTLEGGPIGFKSDALPLPVTLEGGPVNFKSDNIPLPVTYSNIYDEFNSDAYITLPAGVYGIPSMQSDNPITLPVNFPNDILEFNFNGTPAALPIGFEINFPELGFGAVTGNIKYINDNVTILGEGTTTGNIKYRGAIKADGTFATTAPLNMVNTVKYYELSEVSTVDNYLSFSQAHPAGSTSILKKTAALSGNQSGGISYIVNDTGSRYFVYFSPTDDDDAWVGDSNKMGVYLDNGNLQLYHGGSNVYSRGAINGTQIDFFRDSQGKYRCLINGALEYTFNSTLTGDLYLIASPHAFVNRVDLTDAYVINSVSLVAEPDNFIVNFYGSGYSTGPFKKHTGTPQIQWDNLTNPTKITWNTLENYSETGNGLDGYLIRATGKNSTYTGGISNETISPGEGIVFRMHQELNRGMMFGFDPVQDVNQSIYTNTNHLFYFDNNQHDHRYYENGSQISLYHNYDWDLGDTYAIVYENSTTLKVVLNGSVIYTRTVSTGGAPMYVTVNNDYPDYWAVPVWKAPAADLLGANMHQITITYSNEQQLTFDPANITGMTESNGVLTKTAGNGWNNGVASSTETVSTGEGVHFPHPTSWPNGTKAFYGFDHEGNTAYTQIDMAVRTDNTDLSANNMKFWRDGNALSPFYANWAEGMDVCLYRHSSKKWWLYLDGVLQRYDDNLTEYINFDVSNKTKLTSSYWDVMQDTLYYDSKVVSSIQTLMNTGNNWNKHMKSVEFIPANGEGYIEWYIDTISSQYVVVGINEVYDGSQYLDFFAEHQANQISVWMGNTQETPSVPGGKLTAQYRDKIRLTRKSNGVVQVHVNDTLYHQFSGTNTNKMYFEIHAYQEHSRIINVVHSVNGSAPAPLTWGIAENLIETKAPYYEANTT